MSVSKEGLNRYHSTLAGRTYASEKKARHYDSLERAKSSPDSRGSKILASLSQSDLKSLVTEMRIQADQPVSGMSWEQAQREFVANNPDFVLSRENGGALAALLAAQGKLLPHGEFVGTADDFQAAYAELAQRNVVKLKDGAPLPVTPFNEQEAYEMPLEELRKKAWGW